MSMHPATALPPARPPTSPREPGAARHGTRRRRVVLTVVGALVALLVLGAIAVGTLLGAKGTAVATKVFQGGGSPLQLVAPGAPLRTDAQGRSNILVIGTSQDDPGHANGPGGQGMWLTDSIQLVSYDQRRASATMIAIPRDLWVRLPTPCVVGGEAKINAVYECASGLFSQQQSAVPDYPAVDARGAQALMRTVSEVTGLQVQYYVHVDYSVVRQAVDAVGGVNVDIVGDGHPGIFDTNQDQYGGCPGEQVSCRTVYYPRNGVYHLDGAHALALARARGDANPRSSLNYGLARGDLDREANQQKVMLALAHQAASIGVLANPVAVSNLLTALGDNVTTNLSTGEAKTLFDFVRTKGTTGISSYTLTDPAKPLLRIGWAGPQSVVRPVAGLFDYSAIHSALGPLPR